MANWRKRDRKGQWRWANTYGTGVSEKEKNENGEQEIIEEVIEENLSLWKKGKRFRWTDPRDPAQGTENNPQKPLHGISEHG